MRTMMTVLMGLLFTVFTGCSNGDTLLKSDEELIFEQGAVAFIVKIDSLNETIEGYYLDETVPKTTFNATCIKALEGECTTNLVISRYGGTVDGEFIGVENELIGYPEYIEIDENLSTSNLYEIGEYYLVVLKENNNEYQTANLHHLEDYNSSYEWDNQPSGKSKRIIFAFQHNMEAYREHLEE